MKHVAVVGAGVIGLCSADVLLRRGYRVTVLERDASPGSGCSYGNGGLIVPSHFEPLACPGMVSTGLRMLRSKESPFGFTGFPGWEMASWMVRFAFAGTRAHVERCSPVLRDLNLASRTLYEERYAEIQSGYQRLGELMVCKTPAGLEAEARLAREAERLGMKTSVMDRADLARFESGIEVEAAGAVYFEDDAHLTPRLFMPGLRDRVVKQGGVIHDDAEVCGFDVRDGRIATVRLGDGVIEVDELVIAAGSWSGRLARMLGFRMPLLGGKGYGFTVPDPPATPKYPAILVDGRVAVTPMLNGVRFVGTMEIGLPNEPKMNEARLKGMRRSIADFYPAYRGVDLTPHHVWSGLRPVSPDGMPYIGRPRQVSNATVATGHGMMGMSLGPITGELVAQIIDGQAPAISLDLMSPNRYG